MEDRKIYVSSTGDAFVDPAKDVNIPEENKMSESLFTKFTKKMAGIDEKITQRVVNKEGYDLWRRRKEIAEGYNQGKYFDKAHNLDIFSGLVFKLAGLVGAQEEVVEVLAPTIRQLIKTTNNPILKQFLAVTTTGILRAETAKEVALKEKLFKKIDATLDVLKVTGSHAFQFIKTVAGYIGNEIKQLSQNFVTSTDDFIANLLTNAGFLGPFVKMLWPYIERAIGLLRKAIWGGLKFLAKGMFSPVKYLGQMLVSKIFAPKKETVASVATSKSLVKGFSALKGSLDLIKNIVGEEKVVNSKIFSKVSKIASTISGNHSLGETTQSPFTKLSNVFKGGYFGNKDRVTASENVPPKVAYAKAPAFASLGGLFSFSKYEEIKKKHTESNNKNEKIKEESKSFSFFNFLKKNKEEAKVHRQEQKEESRKYRKTKPDFIVGSFGSVAVPFIKTVNVPNKSVVLEGVSHSNKKQFEQSIIIKKINQIYKQIVRLTKSTVNRIKTTDKIQNKISSTLSRIKVLQTKTVSKISSITKNNIVDNLKSTVKQFGSFIFKGFISTTRKIGSYLYDKLNIKSIKESKIYQKLFDTIQKSNNKVVTSLRIISKKLQSPKEKFSEKIFERRQEEKKIKIQERTNNLLSKLIKTTKNTVSKVNTSSPFNMLKNILGGIFSFGTNILGSLFTGASKFIWLLLGALGIKSLGGWIFKGIKNSISWIAGKLISGVKSFAKNIGPWIVKSLKNALKLVFTIGKGILKKLGVIGLVLTGIDLLKKPLIWLKDKVLELFKLPGKIIGGIKDFFVKKLAGIKEAVQGIFDPLKKFISEKFTTLLKFLAKIPVVGNLVKPLLNKEVKPKTPPKTETGSKSKPNNTVKNETKTSTTKPAETVKNKTKVVTGSVKQTANNIKKESKVLSKGLNLAKTTLKTTVKVAEKGLAPAFLVYDQVKHGFNTEESFGLDIHDTTWDQRLSQMSGTVVDSLSLGIIDRKTAAKNIDTTINWALHLIGKGREDRVAKALKTYTPGNAYIYDYYPDEGKYILAVPGTNLKFIKFKSGVYKIGNKYVTEPEADIIISYYLKHKKIISKDKFKDISSHRVFPLSHFTSDTDRGYVYFVSQSGNPNKRLYYIYDKKKNEWIISGKRFTDINEVRKVLGNFYKYGKITKEEKQHIKPIHSKSTSTQLKNETKPSVITSVTNVLTSVSDKFKNIITKKSSQQNEIKDISDLVKNKNDNQVVEKIVSQLSKKEKQVYSISRKVLSDNNITATEIGRSSNELKPINLTNLPVNIPNLTAMLVKHEGIKLHEYKDHLGYKTIGIGHLVDERRNGIPLKKILGVDKKQITLGEALYVFAYDLKRIGTQLFNKLPWLKKKPEPVREALLDMAFQVGVGGLLKFKPTLELIKQDKYTEAAKRLEKSLWFKQTKERASEIIQKIVSVTPTIIDVAQNPVKSAAGAALSLAVATANPNIPNINQKIITTKNHVAQHKISTPKFNQSNQKISNLITTSNINQSLVSIPKTNQSLIKSVKNQKISNPTSNINQSLVSIPKTNQPIIESIKHQNKENEKIHQQVITADTISIEKLITGSSTIYLNNKNNIATKSHIAENNISQPIRNLVTNLNTGISNITSPSQILTRTFDMREQVLVSRNNTYRKSQQATNHNSEITQVHNVPIMINQQQYINNVQQTSYNHATKFIQPTGKADSMKFNVEFS